ncbi:RNA polymerase sigma factor [Aliikangiella maris]|uniref:RNA polymerase sigma factor n=2 Tax=Aliikangiella maris TaxID=3162458 RepID=A0ABV2BZB9_9GAMM
MSPLLPDKANAAVLMTSHSMPLSEGQSYNQYFEETLSEYHSMISRVVSSYERSQALQEELYQEISVALWKALAKFDGQSSLKTYILSIAHKRAVSHVARYVKEPEAVEINELSLTGGDCPVQQIQQNQRIQQLIESIRLLSLVERQLVTLALEGLSYKEIGEILGLNTSHVGVKLNRAKNKLSLIMEKFSTGGSHE